MFVNMACVSAVECDCVCMKRRWEQRQPQGLSVTACFLYESTNNQCIPPDYPSWEVSILERNGGSQRSHYFPKVTRRGVAELARLSASKARDTNCSASLVMAQDGTAGRSCFLIIMLAHLTRVRGPLVPSL